MRRICNFFGLVVLLSVQNVCYCAESDNFRQETAKVLYVNHKYLRYLNVFTFRHTRNSPYLTSANGSNTMPLDNNFTLIVDCYSAKTEIFSFELKLCDVLKMEWAKEWLQTYTDLPMKCPFPVGEYHFNELEIPPKNFPIPLPAGDYTMGLHAFAGKTKEKVVDIKINLRFQAKKNKIG